MPSGKVLFPLSHMSTDLLKTHDKTQRNSFTQQFKYLMCARLSANRLGYSSELSGATLQNNLFNKHFR